MKELEQISAYITQLETERAELNKQIDTLKSDIEILSYSVKNICAPRLQDVDFRTKLIKDLASNIQDKIDILQSEYDDLSSTVEDVTAATRNNDLHCPEQLDIRDEDKIRSLYEVVEEAVAKSKNANVDSITPDDKITALCTYIKRIGDAVDWKYTDDDRQWTYEHLNELVAIVEGNYAVIKNLDAMADEVESITQEIQNDNFGLYRTFSSTHIALNTYKFEPTRELAGTIQKLSDAFIQSCSYLDVAIGNLKVAQLCNLNEEIEDCQEQIHAWIARSGATRWLDHRP